MTDGGYFPRATSILRRVHEERAVGLFYGQRALGLGALAPLNFIGTRRHSRAVDQPFRRLVRTANMFETIFFGTKAEADRVLKLVDAMHQEVAGEIPEPAGPYPAGSRYSAYDPEMMLWTVGVMADSAVVFHEMFVRPLSADEKDAFWADYVRFAGLFGMPADAAPGSWAAFKAWLDGFIASDRAFLTDEARHTANAIMFRIPVPRSRRPGILAHNVIMLASLPPRVRELYGLDYTRRHEAVFHGLLGLSRLTRPLATDRMRRGYNTKDFEMVAATERRIIAAGGTPPGALPPVDAAQEGAATSAVRTS
jgi:uncharacterized protein (DUF2236 family)